MQADRVHTWCPNQDFGGGLAVSDEWEDEDIRSARRPGRRRRRRHRYVEDGGIRRMRRGRSRGEGGDDDGLEPETLLTPEERAYRQARRVAEQKTRLASEIFPLLVITALLLVFHLWPVALIVLLCWGWGPARRAYRLFVEPKVRERFIEQEVEKQVHATLSRERQALEGEHARSMQQLSASIAHEIRNPITAAKSLVQQMEEDPTSRENVEYARVALEELQRVERSVSHLLRFARDEEMGIVEVRMAEVIESALETFRDRLERAGIALERRIDGEGLMRGDAEKLRRVVINLVGNAIDALGESGTPDPKVEVAMGENLASTEVWVRIKDNGPGIDDAAQQEMFSPFYTSKAEGTGLGLAICRKLVDAHGGIIEVSSEPHGGAEFLVTFPKARGEKEVEP
jgi:signal transduction histidine kinase